MQLPPLSRTARRHPPEDMPARFDRWLDGEAGQAVLRAERAMLADWVPKLVGHRAMELSAARNRDMLNGIRLPWRCSLAGLSSRDGRQDQDADNGGTPPVSLEGSVECLPIAKNSLDVLLMHHCLEFQQAPHQILREAARCVAPGGVLAVVGFQPFSALGLARWFRPAGERRPGWRGRYFRPYRVTDWLNVLGFEVEGLASGFYNLPLGDRGRARLSGLEWLGTRLWWRHGGAYLLVARKRAAMMRPTPVRGGHFSRQRPTVVAVPVARWRQQRDTE